MNESFSYSCIGRISKTCYNGMARETIPGQSDESEGICADVELILMNWTLNLGIQK
jgi:hypothetical protein